MGTVIIKLLNEHYKTEKDMERLLRYVAAKGKNKQKELLLQSSGKGVSFNPEKATKQMKAVQRAYGKTSGRRLYHLVVSFPKAIRNKEAVTNAAECIAEMLFEDYQVFYGIHASTDNLHVHYAINTVSYATGKKWHQNKKELAEMKEIIFQLIRHSGLHVDGFI